MRDPNKRVGASEGVHVKAVVQVAPVQSILFPILGISIVTVCDVPKALAIDTSSCGSGTLEVQFEAVDQLPLLAFCQV